MHFIDINFNRVDSSHSRPGLPVYDIVLTLTAQDLSSYRSGVHHTNVAGYAYVGGACVKNSMWVLQHFLCKSNFHTIFW